MLIPSLICAPKPGGITGLSETRRFRGHPKPTSKGDHCPKIIQRKEEQQICDNNTNMDDALKAEVIEQDFGDPALTREGFESFSSNGPAWCGMQRLSNSVLQL
jgi:hypothetical protein